MKKFDFSNPYKLGWTLGKFMPFHNGHKWLIDHIINENNGIMILVCGHPSEPMPIEVRQEMITETVKVYKETFPEKDFFIVTYFGDAPQSPDGLDDLQSHAFWVNWKSICNVRLDFLIQKHFPHIDSFEFNLYTGSDYSSKLSEVTYSRWRVVDRKEIEVSGTKVRENIIQNWEYIPKESRLPLMKWIDKVVWGDWKSSDSKSFEINKL